MSKKRVSIPARSIELSPWPEEGATWSFTYFPKEMVVEFLLEQRPKVVCISKSSPFCCDGLVQLELRSNGASESGYECAE